MKTFNASDMAHKRTEIFEAASTIGAIIQRKNTNSEVLEEFVMIRNNGQSIFSIYEGHEKCRDPQCQLCSFDY